MNKKLVSFTVLLVTAIASGYALFTFLKKAGLEEVFDFDLNEEDEDLF